MLKIVFVGNDNEFLGQRLKLDQISERTTLEYAAQQILKFLRKTASDLSFVAEYGPALKLFTNRRRVTGDGSRNSIESLTGFLTTGISCCVDSFVERGCIRVRLGKKDQFIDVLLNPFDTILQLKLKISQNTSIPVEKQCLKFNKSVLTNEQTTRDLGIEEGDELWMFSEHRDLVIWMPNRSIVRIKVYNEEKVSQIITRICEEADISRKGIIMKYKSGKVDLNRFLGELDIEQEDSLQIKKSIILIHIKMYNGTIFTLDVGNTDSIRSVKDKIMIRQQIPIDNQRLIYNEEELDDSLFLLDYDIQKGSTIDLQPELHFEQTDDTDSLFHTLFSIQIFIKPQVGRMIMLNVQQSDTIENVIMKIQEKINWPLSEPQLIFRGQQLEEDNKIEDYDIEKFDVLYLRTHEPQSIQKQMLIQSSKRNEIQFFVKIMNGRTFAILANKTDTVESVKQKIESKSQISVEQQILSFAGKQLIDERQLQEYDIQNGATLQLEMRLPGGQPTKVFVDVQSGSIVNRRLTTTAPKYRFIKKGLLIEGVCENKDCSAEGEMVIHKVGFSDFDIDISEAFCPLCSKPIKPVKPGFYNCLYRIHFRESRRSCNQNPMGKSR